VIPNAVDIEHFTFYKEGFDEEISGEQAGSVLQEDLCLTGKTVLGFIGSFYAYEGIPLLLEAMPKMVAVNADIRLLLVGGGPQDGIIREKVEQLGLQDIVVMTGRVPHSDVQNYYNLVDIFIYPRLSMRLTDLVTPLKPLEAMAQGKLVAASDVGGHHELITHGKNGNLFQADNVDSLAESVTEMLGNREVWPEMRRAGRAYVEDERNWQNSVSRYQKIYGSFHR